MKNKYSRIQLDPEIENLLKKYGSDQSEKKETLGVSG